jgi:hypothetical protein
MQKRTTIFRAASMLGGLSAVVVGATFALTPVSATLTDSSLTAATAGLVVDGPDENTAFGADDPGFKFENLFPGSTNWSAPQDFSLRNLGTTDLKVAVQVSAGTGELDETKVKVKVTNTTTADTKEYTLSELSTAKNLPGVSEGDDSLEGDPSEVAPVEGETNAFTVQVKLDEGAAGSLSDLDFLFTGTPVDETPVVVPEEPGDE